MEYYSNHIAIPRPFYSDATNAVFERCLGCDRYLLDDGTEYLIEKAFRQYPGYDFVDTVFEYAMCLDCVARLQQAMSEESMQRVRAYFEHRVDPFARRRHLIERERFDAREWISACFVTGKPVASMTEYQIYAHCEGRSLVMSLFPYAIGGDVIEEVGALLSNKTLGEIDGFMSDHFGLPPELRKLLLENHIVTI